MKALARHLLPFVDVVMTPFVYPSAYLLKAVRRLGVQRLPLCKDALMKIGVFPIRDHYYEPRFKPDLAARPYSQPRQLPGIDWSIDAQLGLLECMVFAHELAKLPQAPRGPLQFHFNNGFFESGDAEYWYQMIRLKKPARIVEAGSGNSTLIAALAIRRNRQDDPSYVCEHVCIEPYEAPWLEQLGVQVIRRRIEELEVSFFSNLQADDILFIDSSHMIKPQGDVVFELLELLPLLKPGVIVHVHDIFSPRDYLKKWIIDEVRLWNEQYLLEAFLSHNEQWRIIGALNYLHHEYPEQLKQAAPFLTPQREPCSFYIQRVGVREQPSRAGFQVL